MSSETWTCRRKWSFWGEEGWIKCCVQIAPDRLDTSSLDRLQKTWEVSPRGGMLAQWKIKSHSICKNLHNVPSRMWKGRLRHRFPKRPDMRRFVLWHWNLESVHQTRSETHAEYSAPWDAEYRERSPVRRWKVELRPKRVLTMAIIILNIRKGEEFCSCNDKKNYFFFYLTYEAGTLIPCPNTPKQDVCQNGNYGLR